MDETLIIEKLGPIRKLEIRPRPLTIIIGEQAAGKSLVARVLYFFRGLESHLARFYKPESNALRSLSKATTSIRDSLRGVIFGSYFTDGAVVEYHDVDRGIQWRIDLDELPALSSKQLIKHIISLVQHRFQDHAELGRIREGNQIFVPANRSMFTTFWHRQPSVLYAPCQPEPFRRFADLVKGAGRISITALEKLNQQQLETGKFVKACGQRALGGEAFVTGPGRVWMWRVASTSNAKTLPIEATTSGQMEAWPFFAIAATFGSRIPSGLDFYFEEPETHLHPAAQVEVIKVIAYLVNKGHRFVVTTHSPFIAYVVNNMMQRFMSYKGQIPEGQVALNPDDVAAYRLRQSPDEPPEDIMDREDTKLLKLDELERVADELEAEFDSLMEMAE